MSASGRYKEYVGAEKHSRIAVAIGRISRKKDLSLEIQWSGKDSKAGLLFWIFGDYDAPHFMQQRG